MASSHGDRLRSITGPQMKIVIPPVLAIDEFSQRKDVIQQLFSRKRAARTKS
jgi:hypothetical protein